MAARLTAEVLFERELLRKSVRALRAGNKRCRDCRRTLLTGECCFVYQDEGIACALCRPRRREQPVRVLAVRGDMHGGSVRRKVSAAA